MKAEDIKVELIDNCYHAWTKETADNYKEVCDLPTHGAARLTLKDGTEIVVTTSEWTSVYIKEPTV